MKSQKASGSADWHRSHLVSLKELMAAEWWEEGEPGNGAKENLAGKSSC